MRFSPLLWFHNSNIKNIVYPVTVPPNPRNPRIVPSCRTKPPCDLVPNYLFSLGLFYSSQMVCSWSSQNAIDFSCWIFVHIMCFMLTTIPETEPDFILPIPAPVPLLPKLYSLLQTKKRDQLPLGLLWISFHLIFSTEYTLFSLPFCFFFPCHFYILVNLL